MYFVWPVDHSSSIHVIYFDFQITFLYQSNSSLSVNSLATKYKNKFTTWISKIWSKKAFKQYYQRRWKTGYVCIGLRQVRGLLDSTRFLEFIYSTRFLECSFLETKHPKEFDVIHAEELSEQKIVTIKLYSDFLVRLKVRYF